MTNAKVTGAILLVLMSGLFFKTQQYHHLWKDQRAYCEYWVRLSPENPSPNFWLGEAYWIEGNYEKAQHFYIRAINGGKLDWGIYSNLGMIALEKGNFLLAKNYLLEALEINPQAALVYSNLGVVYLRQNDLDQAQKYFMQSLELDPDLLEPRLNLAEIARMNGEMEKAVQLNGEVLSRDPWNTASLYFLILYAIEAENNYSKGEQLSQRLLKSPRKIAGNTLTDLGSLFASHNYTQLAKVFYEKALKAVPVYKETYIEFGKLQGNLGHLPEAIAIWEAGLKLDPSDQRFLEFIEKARMVQNQENITNH